MIDITAAVKHNGGDALLESALRKGQTVEVLGTEGDFARIDYRGRTGYVSTRYLQSAGDK